jgi:hypothetical protein
VLTGVGGVNYLRHKLLHLSNCYTQTTSFLAKTTILTEGGGSLLRVVFSETFVASVKMVFHF